MNSPLLLLVFFFLFINGILSYPIYHPSEQYYSFIECANDYSHEDFRSIVYESTINATYPSVLQSYIKNSRFNTLTTPKPLFVVTPTKTSQVRATTYCAGQNFIQVRIRSGGHDYEGISYTSPDSSSAFIVLDMFNFRNISVDVQSETAYVQVGAQVGELLYNIWLKSKVHGFPAGVCPTLGIGGHISGGGYGNMLRKYGLTVDQVIDAEIFNHHGDYYNLIKDRKQMGEDLFWAIRGGGGSSFGIILSFTVKLVRVPETVIIFKVMKTLKENATNIVYKWQFLANTIDHNLFIRVLLQPINGSVQATFIGQFLGNSTTLLEIIDKDFPELGLKKEDCIGMSWINSVLYWANFDNTTTPDILINRHSDNVGFWKRKSDYVQNPISISELDSIWKKMIELGKVELVFDMYGGKMSEISSTSTPFPHRAGNLYKIQYLVNWKEEEEEEAEENYLSQIRELYKFMTPYVSSNPRASFLNYRDFDIGVNTNYTYEEGKVFGEKYFKGNFDRLVQVKAEVDPSGFFYHEQSIARGFKD